ncbi:MAG: bifunctional hydroxymethylpyrimidine kinase/phosphomethylpyrimidine kinase [Campylobacterales bacterium]|nr:bifunctional hydroxymethylpyrimidine kinase/phosphomethylpyrimidine kinase [Campylobacterales bacterium]
MKVVLSIAGSDSSGGAGIQADLKTFEAFGVFGASVITVATAQNTQGVTAVFPFSAEFVKQQIDAVFADLDVAAVKIGMLYSKEIMEVVLETVKKLDIPVVLDPVYISKAGSVLMKEEDGEFLKEFFGYVSVVTPNIYEAQKLFGYSFGDSPSLQNIIDAKIPVLVKNEKLELHGEKFSIDQLFYEHKKRVFKTPALDSINIHGTGCSYSSAIAANLALGKTLDEAVEISKEFIYAAIKYAPSIGNGYGPINHKEGAMQCQRY